MGISTVLKGIGIKITGSQAFMGQVAEYWADFFFSVSPKRPQSQGGEAIIIDFQNVMACIRLAHLHSGPSKKTSCKA